MRIAALVIGMLLLALGAAGFVPGFTTDGLLFGVVPMDHLIGGVAIAIGLAALAFSVARREPLAPSARSSSQDMRSWMN